MNTVGVVNATESCVQETETAAAVLVATLSRNENERCSVARCGTYGSKNRHDLATNHLLNGETLLMATHVCTRTGTMTIHPLSGTFRVTARN